MVAGRVGGSDVGAEGLGAADDPGSGVSKVGAQPSTGLLRACGSLPRSSHFAVLE